MKASPFRPWHTAAEHGLKIFRHGESAAQNPLCERTSSALSTGLEAFGSMGKVPSFADGGKRGCPQAAKQRPRIREEGKCWTSFSSWSRPPQRQLRRSKQEAAGILCTRRWTQGKTGPVIR
jgi:hypothetical protein